MTKNQITMIAQTKLPTKYGKFKLYLYSEKTGGREHLALVYGNIMEQAKFIPVRIHSACLTGDVFGSLRCDCQTQLHQAMEIIQKNGFGIIIYLDQEGRGIGLANKIKTYVLQDQGLDTAQANEKLGFKTDERDFTIAGNILKDLGVKQVELMTNHPQKVSDLKKAGIKVKRQSFWVGRNKYNRGYLRVKREKLGHLEN